MSDSHTDEDRFFYLLRASGTVVRADTQTYLSVQKVASVPRRYAYSTHLIGAAAPAGLAIPLDPSASVDLSVSDRSVPVGDPCPSASYSRPSASPVQKQVLRASYDRCAPPPLPLRAEIDRSAGSVAEHVRRGRAKAVCLSVRRGSTLIARSSSRAIGCSTETAECRTYHFTSLAVVFAPCPRRHTTKLQTNENQWTT